MKEFSASVKTEAAKIRSLPKGKRLEYIWEYYRLTLFLTAFSLFFLVAIGSFLVNGLIRTLNPKESVSIAFCAPGFSNCEEWIACCQTAIGYNEAEEDLQILVAQPLSDTSDTFRVSASVWLANGQPDIFITDEISYQYLLELEALAELSKTWPEELLLQAKDRCISPYALDISDTPIAEAYGITNKPVYLCMYLHGNGFQRALDIAEYILTEE